MPTATAANSMLLIYKGLRLDVTPKATSPGLLTYEGTTEIAAALKPITSDNPLGLGLHFASLNAPGVSVSGLGVDAVSSPFPGGTEGAHSRAATFVEAHEIYAIAPLSQEKEIHDLWRTHVYNMSQPDESGERIVFINPKMPVEKLPKLVASGTDGDYVTTNTFDTKVTGLSQALLAAGVDPNNIQASDGVYLDISLDTKKYNISGLNGTQVTIRTTFSPGENDDAYYSAVNLPITLISETFSLNVRGAKLLDTNGLPDYLARAKAYVDLAKTYKYRRVTLVAPEACAASIGGTEQQLEGYYLCAALSGMTGQQPPQQGFTNFPITGFTRVIGSNDKFSKKQLNIGAGGGVFWVVQDQAGSAVYGRHQLTTDTSTIEKRELSINRVVDYVSKFMRIGLRTFIGRFNITQSFLDTISAVIKGQLLFLADAGIIIGGEVVHIKQDPTNPDTLLVQVLLDVPYPCNYIKLTLVV